MTGSGNIDKTAPHVSISKGSNQKFQVGGYDNKEGVALLVTDTGRKGFSAPLHPVVTVTATVTNLNDLVKAEYARLTAAKRTALGLTSATANVAITARRGFLIKALATNGGLIYLGTQYIKAGASGTAADEVGFVLEAGASLFIEITDGANLFFQATDSDESMCWLAL